MDDTYDLLALNNLTTSIKPSTMTLVLAPPGHGKVGLSLLAANAMHPDVTIVLATCNHNVANTHHHVVCTCDLTMTEHTAESY